MGQLSLSHYHLVHALFPLSHSYSNTLNFLEMLNLFQKHFSFVYCGFLGPPALPFATVPIISFILRADSTFSTAILHYISDWLLLKAGRSSLVGCESHAS